MGAITPASFEKIAQSYAKLIRAGEKTLEEIPKSPAKIYNRVVELLENPELIETEEE